MAKCQSSASSERVLDFANPMELESLVGNNLDLLCKQTKMMSLLFRKLSAESRSTSLRMPSQSDEASMSQSNTPCISRKTSRKRRFVTSSSKCLSRTGSVDESLQDWETFSDLGGGRLSVASTNGARSIGGASFPTDSDMHQVGRTSSRLEIDESEYIENIPSLSFNDEKQISILVTAPSADDIRDVPEADDSPRDFEPDWSPPTRRAAKTVWDDCSMTDLMKQFDGSSEVFDDVVQEEIEADPVLWCLSHDARQKLQNPAQVVSMLHDLQRCINLIDLFIPQMTTILNEQQDSQIFMTNVIQELLKRAQEHGMSNRIRNDFSMVSYALEDQELYSQEDIQKMVKLIAWVRNNITASCVTDENDAKMASMGAREVQQSLKGLLKIQANAPRHSATEDYLMALNKNDSRIVE